MKSAKKHKAAVSRVLHKANPRVDDRNEPIAEGAFYMAKPRVFVHGIALDERLAGETEVHPAAKAH